MGNFSRDPSQVLASSLAKGYVGVRIEQNVPLLDRDINLSTDLVAASLRDVIHRYVGAGTAVNSDDAFAIGVAAAPTDNFHIGAGAMLAGGLRVASSGLDYVSQVGVDPLTAPLAGQARIDTVYLDVWLQEIDTDADPDIDLGNVADIGFPTSIRLKPTWRVRVKQSALDPPVAAPGHVHVPLARLERQGPDIVAAQIVDLRVKRLNLADLVTRVTALEADIALLRSALAPKFAALRPFDKPSGYADRAVVLHGKNFDLGAVSVLFRVGPAAAAVTILGEPQPTTINVRIGDDCPTGDGNFFVTTALGTTTSGAFRNWGPPAFHTATPFSPTSVGLGDNFTINSLFCDAPNIEVQCQPSGFAPSDPWKPLTVISTTQTSLVAQIPALLGPPGPYRLRMRSAVSPQWSQPLLFQLITITP